jgi:putative redox protein
MSNTNQTPAITAHVGQVCYSTEIKAGNHTLWIDESKEHNGQDAGPDAFTTFYAALAGCVLMSIRHYATRKELPLESADLDLYPQRERGHPVESIRMDLRLHGDLTDKDRDRILKIAGGCLIHRSLEQGVKVTSRLID